MPDVSSNCYDIRNFLRLINGVNDKGYWLDDFEIVSVVDSGISRTPIEEEIKATRDSRIKVLSL